MDDLEVLTRERKRLEALFGQVWNTKEMQDDFRVSSFLAPYVMVARKSDGQIGTLQFQHAPRFYFKFQAE